MSETQAPDSSSGGLDDDAARVLFAYDVSKEGRIVTRLYGFERAGHDIRVAAEIYPVGAPQDSQPQWRFYDFRARDRAHHFADETLLALEYLGCIVTERPAARSAVSPNARAQVA